MRKLTQLELLEEGFLDSMRRAGGIARAAVKGAAKGIYAMDPGGFDTIAAPFKTIAAPITGALKQIKQDDPVSFLKEELKTNRSIELIKVVSQKTQNANIPINKKVSQFDRFDTTNRDSTSARIANDVGSATGAVSTRIKNLMGISKTVTIITFWGNTYRSGTERQYKAYGEASELIISYGDNMIPIITQLEAASISTTTPSTSSAAPEQGDQQPPAPEQEDQQPPVPGAKLMTDEVFRTSRGLVLGDIYDPKTGDVISEYREKQQPFSFENAKANFFANQQTPISPNTTELSVQDATNLIKYLFQIKSKNYDTAQPAEKSGFEAILSNATAASANVKVSDIKSVAKQTRIAENTHVSQKVLLEQISRL